MTVSQLIQALSQKAPNARVVIRNGDVDEDFEVIDAMTKEEGGEIVVELLTE